MRSGASSARTEGGITAGSDFRNHDIIRCRARSSISTIQVARYRKAVEDFVKLSVAVGLLLAIASQIGQIMLVGIGADPANIDGANVINERHAFGTCALDEFASALIGEPHC